MKIKTTNSIVEKVFEYAEDLGHKTAIIADDAVLTYSELRQKIIAFSKYLQGKGVQKGDCVLIQTSHTASFIISYLAVHIAGAIFVPIDKAASNDYMNHILCMTDAKFLIAFKNDKAFDINCEVIRYDGSVTHESEPFCAAVELPEKDQSADLVFTTGTTGESKGVELQHGAVIAGIENFTVGYWPENDMRYLVYGPLNHTFTLRRMYALLYTGNTIVLLEGLLNIKKFFDLIEMYTINATHMNPSAVRMILSLTKDKLSDYAQQFWLIETGTAPYPETDKEKLHSLLPKTTLSFGYGCSESDAVARYNYSEYMGRSGCVGRPTINSQISIVNENREVIQSSRDNYGLISCKGPMIMKGYWREPVLTAQVMQDGVIYTNDIGYFDEDGFLYVLGRANDVINVGGIKVAAKEIEDQALMIPGIVECACIAVDDVMSSQVPKLFVVMDSEYTFSPISITEHLSKSLETYKLPKHIVKIEELPKTYNGKIQKNLLK